MIKQFAVMAIVLSIGGCTDASQANRQRAEDRGKIGITKNFLDPASVQFRNVKTGIVLSSYRVCGELNGKNSYGGYVGFKRFIASLNATSDLKYEGGYIEGEQGFDVQWASYCK